MSTKPYLTSRQVADLLGVSEAIVIADIERGCTGDMDALFGGQAGDFWLVEAWDLTGERLEMHRRRLCAADREGVVT